MRNTLWILALVLVAGAAAPSHAMQGKPPARGAAAKYDAAKLKTLEAKLAKNPKDAKLALEVAEANYQVGHAMMYDETLPPRQKYRPALKHFRRAMELNPKHAKAAADRKQIEDIYKQMGMPIPQ